MSIPDEAVEAATSALLKAWGYGITTNAATAADLRVALEAAAPYMLAEVWQSAYAQGIDDERTSQSNPGIAGCFCSSWPCRCVIAPARRNPYRSEP